MRPLVSLLPSGPATSRRFPASKVNTFTSVFLFGGLVLQQQQLTHLSWASASGGCANCYQLLYEDVKRFALQWTTSYLNRGAVSIIREITYGDGQTLTNP